jgi:hypothetical protein
MGSVYSKEEDRSAEPIYTVTLQLTFILYIVLLLQSLVVNTIPCLKKLPLFDSFSER